MNIDRYVFTCGNGEPVYYLAPDALAVGDYGGAGVVGEANLRVLLERAKEEGFEVGEYSPDWCLNRETGDYEPVDADLFADDFDAPDDAPVVNICYGAYGSRWALLKEGHPFTDQIIKELEDYPCLDDDAMTEVENEWANEAITDLVDEAVCELSSMNVLENVPEEEIRTVALELAHEALHSKYWDYVKFEYSGAYIPPEVLEYVIDRARDELTKQNA